MINVQGLGFGRARFGFRGPVLGGWLYIGEEGLYIETMVKGVGFWIEDSRFRYRVCGLGF